MNGTTKMQRRSVLVAIAILTSLVCITGATAFASEGERSGRTSSSNSVPGSLGSARSGGNGGFDSARDIQERGTGSVAPRVPTISDEGSSTADATSTAPIPGVARFAIVPDVVAPDTNVTDDRVEEAIVDDTSDLETVLELIARIRELMELYGISSDFSFDDLDGLDVIFDSDLEDNQLTEEDARRILDGSADFRGAMHISIEKNSDIKNPGSGRTTSSRVRLNSAQPRESPFIDPTGRERARDISMSSSGSSHGGWIIDGVGRIFGRVATILGF